MDQEHYTLTEGELENLVEKSVNRALRKLGLDTDEPEKLQRNFSRLNEWVETTDTIKRQTLIGTVTLFIAGVGAVLWMGFKQMVNLNGG